MKNNLILGIILLSLLIGCNNEKKSEKTAAMNSDKSNIQKQEKNIYQFSVTDLYGDTFDFASLKGKKIMVVNTASECGNTPQYEGLQKLYDTYKEKDFVIVGFPANNFGQQEPGSDKEIAAFCKENYGVTFPMMSKISVKGETMDEVYEFLTTKKLNGKKDSEVTWNFQKYLLDKNGELVKVVDPKTLPWDASIVSWIEGE